MTRPDEVGPLVENILPVRHYLYTNENFPCLVDKGEQAENIHSATTESERYRRIARNALRHLTYGTSLYECGLLTWENFKALFIQRNPKLLQSLHIEIQKIFFNAYQLLLDNKLDEQAEARLSIFIKNVLATIPYFDPLDPMINIPLIKIPQKIDDTWQLCEFEYKQIDISPQTGLLSKLIGDEERLYAYGLEAKEQSVHPYLILMGSHYPSGQGALINWLYNFSPFKSVGEDHDLTNIESWLQAHPQAIVTGHSKGGTMAMLLSVKYPDLIFEANCLNAAPLSHHTLKRLEQLQSVVNPNQKINVYVQVNDPVFLLGKEFIRGAMVYSVGTSLTASPIVAHASYFAGRKSSYIKNFESKDMESKSSIRAYLTYLKDYMNLIIFPILYGYLLYAVAAKNILKIWDKYQSVITKTSTIASALLCFGIVASGVFAPILTPIIAKLGPILAYTFAAAVSTGICALTARILPAVIISTAVVVSHAVLAAGLIVGGVLSCMIGTCAYTAKSVANRFFTHQQQPMSLTENFNSVANQRVGSYHYLKPFILTPSKPHPKSNLEPQKIIEQVPKTNLMNKLIDLDPDLFKTDLNADRNQDKITKPNVTAKLNNRIKY